MSVNYCIAMPYGEISGKSKNEKQKKTTKKHIITPCISIVKKRPRVIETRILGLAVECARSILGCSQILLPDQKRYFLFHFLNNYPSDTWILRVFAMNHITGITLKNMMNESCIRLMGVEYGIARTKKCDTLCSHRSSNMKRTTVVADEKCCFFAHSRKR